ncbi:MAG TPA: hypothetical protein VJ302_37085 [Blastocatellia bacterium]|nr:hypothetical protein [Blastocatellia bacterium]
MGVRRRMGCEYLPEKLLQIRKALELSQPGLLHRMALRDKRIKTLIKQNISSYEQGTTEPPLPVLLQYARLAGVCVEVLIDDDLELPAQLPAKHPHKP